MEDYLKRIIYELLFYRRTPLAATEWFLNKPHNNFLVPEFDIRISDILDSFEKYRRVSYDTQGLRDHGIDVVLRYFTGKNDDPHWKYLGFQLKSYNDLCEKGWLTKLKAQVYEAKNHVSMEDFYVILCTDSREHLDQLRYVQAEFSKDETTHIVRPEYSRTFYSLSPQRIGAFLKVHLSDEDGVYLEAFKSMTELTPHQAAIVIELVVCYFLEGISAWPIEELRQQVFIQSIYNELPNLPIFYYMGDYEQEGQGEITLEEDQNKSWPDDLEKLESGFIKRELRTDIIKLEPLQIPAVSVMALDGYVRYGYSGEELRNYLMATLLGEKLWVAEEYQQAY